MFYSCCLVILLCLFFFFKQKTAYEMRISDWSSDVCSSDLAERAFRLALIRDVASTYFASREADERIALAEATVRSRQEGLRIAERRLEAGVTSALDFRQAESLLTQAETELASLRLAEA